MRPSKNVVEETVLAWSAEPGWAGVRLDSAIDRVGRYAQSIHADPLTCDRDGRSGVGVALWSRPHPARLWPLWHHEGERALALSGVPTGTGRLTTETDPGQAMAALANLVCEDPRRVHALNPPIAAAILAGDRVSVTADALGVGRLFERRFEGGVAWSNRPGALAVFAGGQINPDEDAWRIFAAAGWFLGTASPLAGIHRVPAGVIVSAKAGGRPLAANPGARTALTCKRRASREQAADQAAAGIRALAGELGRAWSEPIAVSLTGGRDSRLSAAAVIAAGTPARFNTGDAVPGEADAARALVAAAPGDNEHSVYTPDPDEDHPDPLIDRVERMHMIHDGLRNPQEVRRPTEVPHSQLLPPTLSGHGGEIAHGFYYPDKTRLRTLRRSGRRGPLKQLERTARRGHSAATAEGYAAYREICHAILREAVHDLGQIGPASLDYFYLAERLAHRSGLAARSGRTSACTTLEFVRAAFDLKPRHRLENRLHLDVIARLVPEWAEVPFFAAEKGTLPELKRRRIWEGPEGTELDEIISSGGAWETCFDPDKVREIWREARSGAGRGEYEHVFYRVIWREAFERHLEKLGAAGSG